MLLAFPVAAHAGAQPPGLLCERGRPEQVLLAEDFEFGAPGFTTSPLDGSAWSLAVTGGSGASTGWTASGVGPLVVDSLLSPPVALPVDAEQLLLAFAAARDVEGSGTGTCFDAAVVRIDAGAGPLPLAGPAVVSDAYTGIVASGFGNPLAGLEAWCDRTDGFTRTVLDLAAFRGERVTIQFTLATDESVETGTPWRVDDLAVVACGAQDILFSSSFEPAP